MKIVIDVSLYQPGIQMLKSLGGLEIDSLDYPDGEAPARLVDPGRLRDAEILFCSYPPVNFDEMKSLRWIQLGSSGYKQLFGLPLAKRGIRATNARGCFDVPIAEWNLGMMIFLVRSVRQMIYNQDRRIWDRNSAVFGREIRGQTVGIWGYGGIGRETARLARQCGMRVHVMTRKGVSPRREAYTVAGTGDPEGVLPHRVFVAGQESDFLGSLDYLIISMPLTDVTEGLVGERELRALPRTAYLLNPARGKIVQESALLRALRENWIAGAALDSPPQEPLPAEHPLWGLPNAVVTPHISGSGATSTYKDRVWDMLAQNITRFKNGEKLLNELSASELMGQ